MSLIPPPPPGTFDPNPHREQIARVGALQWELQDAYRMREFLNKAVMSFFGIKMMKDCALSQKIITTLAQHCVADLDQLKIRRDANTYAKRAGFLAGFKHYSEEAIRQLEQQLQEAQTALEAAHNKN